jgi:hypothetical protein
VECQTSQIARWRPARRGLVIRSVIRLAWKVVYRIGARGVIEAAMPIGATSPKYYPHFPTF